MLGRGAVTKEGGARRRGGERLLSDRGAEGPAKQEEPSRPFRNSLVGWRPQFDFGSREFGTISIALMRLSSRWRLA